MSSSYENFIESINIERNGLKPIHWACLTSNIEILEKTLQENWDIETKSRNGWRPIHFASFIGNEEMVQFLIEKFCVVDCITDNGETVLDVANGNCNHEFIDEILNENINLKMGLSMGLKCGKDCDHKFCLKYLDQCKFDRSNVIGSSKGIDVFKVRDSNGEQSFAVKVIKISEYDNDPYEKCVLPILNQILPSSNHPNMVKWFGMIKTETEINLFMEFANKRLLWNEIKKNEKFDRDKVCRYSKDILQAVKYLHDSKILHRFIHLTNIHLDNHDRCKLAIAKYSYSLADGDIQINNDWLRKYLNFSLNAPELVENQILSYPYDIYWVGYTVSVMSKGKFENYKSNKCDDLENNILAIDDLVLKSFIKRMVMANPNERATAEQLLDDEFIKNISDDPQIKINKAVSVISNAINNKQIGKLMKLDCNQNCNHKFCLSSVTATNFERGKNIGKGAYGQVHKTEVKSGEYWATKVLKDIDENIKNESKYFENDINQYRQSINHKNIVKYFGSVQNIKEIFIFMEFIDGESLYEKIKANSFKALQENKIKKYTKQILEGLKFLHGQNIIHRDLKSENILINIKDCVKIADFGFSRFLRIISMKDTKTICGTPSYMSPEMLDDQRYNCSADIWSLGATVFEMATGRPPYHEMRVNEIRSKMQTKKIDYPPNMSNEIKEFINLMMNFNQQIRSSADSLLRCEFLNRK